MLLSIAARKMIKPPSLLFDLLHVFVLKGHFVYEGLTMSVFSNDNRKVIVGQGSDYYDSLNCSEILVDGVCEVTVSDYVNAFFGGLYTKDNNIRNAIILGCILAFVRFCTFVALKYLTYSGK